MPWMMSLSTCTMGINASTALRSLPFGIAWIAFSEEQEIMQEVAQTASTIEVINQFNDAFNRHDVQAVMALMTEDCIFENTYPPPDGARFEGQEAVRHFWEEFFRSSPDAVFQSEEMIAHEDRCITRWKYYWTNTDGSRGHVRGVDVLRVRNGKVAEKLAYVMGERLTSTHKRGCRGEVPCRSARCPRTFLSSQSVSLARLRNYDLIPGTDARTVH